MKSPSTKTKGDTGLTQIIANLDLHGIKSALPISDHLPFDLIAINETAKLARVSVKYRKVYRGGIFIPLSTVYANTKKTTVSPVDLNEIDGFAVYCPCSGQCYYVPREVLLQYKSGMTLRVDGLTRKTDGVSNLATDHLDPKVLFGSVTRQGSGPSC